MKQGNRKNAAALLDFKKLIKQNIIY